MFASISWFAVVRSGPGEGLRAVDTTRVADDGHPRVSCGTSRVANDSDDVDGRRTPTAAATRPQHVSVVVSEPARGQTAGSGLHRVHIAYNTAGHDY